MNMLIKYRRIPFKDWDSVRREKFERRVLRKDLGNTQTGRALQPARSYLIRMSSLRQLFFDARNKCKAGRQKKAWSNTVDRRFWGKRAHLYMDLAEDTVHPGTPYCVFHASCESALFQLWAPKLFGVNIGSERSSHRCSIYQLINSSWITALMVPRCIQVRPNESLKLSRLQLNANDYRSWPKGVKDFNIYARPDTVVAISRWLHIVFALASKWRSRCIGSYWLTKYWHSLFCRRNEVTH